MKGMGICQSVVRAQIQNENSVLLIYEEKRLYIHEVVPPTGVHRE